MIALIRKELRELALPAVALVLCAVVIAGMDGLYNRLYPMKQGQGIALTIWAVVSLAIAFLGGGATIARESRQRLIFLTSWPQSRAKLWLVKTVVSFVVTMAVIAFGFLVCLAAPRLGGYYRLGYSARQTFSWLLLYLPLSFVFALMWSALTNSVLAAAALAFATVCALGYGLLWLFILYLPREWGPYFGNIPSHGGWADVHLLVIPLLIPLLAAGWAFARYPILEGKRRLAMALGLLVAMTLVACVLVVAQMALLNRPSLDRSVAETGLVGEGRYRYFLMGAHGSNPGGLWVAPASGGPAKFVAWGKVYRFDSISDSLVVSHTGLGYAGSNYTNWQVVFPSLHLKRLPDSPVYQPGQRPRTKVTS